MEWFLNNLLGLVSLVFMIIGFIAGIVTFKERIKSRLDSHDEKLINLKSDLDEKADNLQKDVDTKVERLEKELDEEKQISKANYLKQEENLKEAIEKFNLRLDKIDEVNNSVNVLRTDMASVKTDMEHVKDDLREVRERIK